MAEGMDKARDEFFSEAQELVESLSLRIVVDVASMTWLWATTQRIEGDRTEKLDVHRSSFDLLMVPALELRLYF